MPPSRPACTGNRGAGGYGLPETAVAVAAVAVLIFVVVAHYSKNINEARETAARAELAALRNTINIFRASKGRCPANLRELATADMVLPFKAGPLEEFEGSARDVVGGEGNTVFNPDYIRAQALDEEGNILDPFGRPYVYDPRECTVRPQEPG